MTAPTVITTMTHGIIMVMEGVATCKAATHPTLTEFQFGIQNSG
jgi:hypothetical protein